MTRMEAVSIVPASATRSQPERRSGFDRRCLTFPEHLFQVIVSLGGGIYKGVQPGDYALGLEPLILFDGPSRSTLALKSSELSSRRVFQEILKKELEFSTLAEQPTATAA
jgi:hypothetical protein